MTKNKITTIILLIFVLFVSTSCNNFFRKVNTRETPLNAQERARKNIEEGKGISVGNVLKRGGTTYEFSTSNPLWRATIEILDFLPLTTVDYSGGIIITDWYSDSTTSKNEAIKITVRFLSNEIQSNSLKIIVHKRKCIADNCDTSLLNTKIKDELSKTILSKAALIQEAEKNKKK